ncbi:hypothetical protein M422DRAFT_240299 [Sphaerobolus stellatus SS14]|nr:hypothetical protein M422DRAFT_240299 [Sphaerobolus stellatus SS14]
MESTGESPLLPLIQQAIKPELMSIDQLRLVNYVAATALTVVLWDTLLNFSREVTYIWKASWSSPKLLYLIIRYYPIGSLLLIVLVSGKLGDSVAFCVCFCHSSEWRQRALYRDKGCYIGKRNLNSST